MHHLQRSAMIKLVRSNNSDNAIERNLLLSPFPYNDFCKQLIELCNASNTMFSRRPIRYMLFYCILLGKCQPTSSPRKVELAAQRNPIEGEKNGFHQIFEFNLPAMNVSTLDRRWWKKWKKLKYHSQTDDDGFLLSSLRPRCYQSKIQLDAKERTRRRTRDHLL